MEISSSWRSATPGEAGSAWANWKPGQFVMVRPASFGLDPLMARARSPSPARTRRAACACSSRSWAREPGRSPPSSPATPLPCGAPLGNAFAMRKDTKTLVLAGGIGIAAVLGIRAPPSAARKTCASSSATAPPIECYDWGALLRPPCRAEAHHETCHQDLMDFIGLLGRRGARILQRRPHRGLWAAAVFYAPSRRSATSTVARPRCPWRIAWPAAWGACLGCVCEHEKEGPVSVCARAARCSGPTKSASRSPSHGYASECGGYGNVQPR